MPNSRGSISLANQQNCEKNSVVFNVRVRVEDLASISEFLITSGYPPKSGGTALSQAIVMFTEALISHKKTKRYELNTAKMFCESVGVATGNRRNARIFGSQFEPTPKQQFATPEEMAEILKKLSEIESEKSKVCINDLTVPKEDELLLTELEKGAPNVVQAQGGEG